MSERKWATYTAEDYPFWCGLDDMEFPEPKPSVVPIIITAIAIITVAAIGWWIGSIMSMDGMSISIGIILGSLSGVVVFKYI